jgi:hypothetical protein
MGNVAFAKLVYSINNVRGGSEGGGVTLKLKRDVMTSGSQVYPCCQPINGIPHSRALMTTALQRIRIDYGFTVWPISRESGKGYLYYYLTGRRFQSREANITSPSVNDSSLPQKYLALHSLSNPLEPNC